MKHITPRAILIPFFTIAVTLMAGLASNNMTIWYLPLIGGAIAVLGEILSYRVFIDTGMTFAALSYFYLNYTLPFNMMNLALLLIIFTVLMMIWVFSRNFLVTSQIRKEMVDPDESVYLKQYEVQSTIDVISILLMAFLVSFIGSLIAFYSYTDILIIPSLAIPLAIVFSATVFFILYFILEVLPRYLKD